MTDERICKHINKPVGKCQLNNVQCAYPACVVAPLPSPPVSGEALGYMRKSDFEQMQNPGTNYAMIYREYVENYCPVPVYAAAAIPVSEPVAWRIENYPGGEWSYFDSLKSACRYAGDHDKLEPLYASPLTNEPAGVTISREHGHKIHEMLKYYFEKHVTDNGEAAALVALSAAIGERG